MSLTRNAYANRLKERRVLSNEDLRAFAPSIFTDHPHSSVSERYVFVPTIDVVERIRNEGFLPVHAGQSKARGADNKIYTKHIVRFRPEAFIDAPEELSPEMLLINSHNRSSAFQLEAGIFRLVCSNGLIVRDNSYGSFRFRHSGDAAERVAAATAGVAEIAGRAIERARDMSKIQISTAQQLRFAQEAAKLRYKDNDQELVKALLVPKRNVETHEHNGNFPRGDLFTTVNVVQENIMLGKVQRTLPSGRKSSTHAVNSVHADLAINRGIWSLAEQFASEVTA